ncbi:2'-5' RNA ligase family protein [Candidatus Pacearchaeota archaeon]|nr:2'-5' RNA ligase family protein [Candidatus Pacearchaeota archaeon]
MKFPIVIYLDKNLTKKIRGIQKRLSKITGSRACLDMETPHITIGSGIKINKKDFELVSMEINSVVKNFKQFKIKIKNYKFMDDWIGGKTPGYTSYVIYLDVVVNENLQKLAEELMDKVTSKHERYYDQPWPYNPHLTVAFKDLDKNGFLKAKEILENEKFEAEMIVDNAAISTEGKNGKWAEYKRFKFG